MHPKKLVATVIGSGRWSEIYRRNINKNQSFILADQNEIFFNKLLQLEDINRTDIIIIATQPQKQVSILKRLVNAKATFILEKPICVNKFDLETFRKIITDRSQDIILNLPSCFNDDIKRLVNYLSKANLTVHSLEICEEGNGPFRRKTSVIYDWYPHVAALLSLFSVQYEDVQLSQIRTSLYGIKYGISGKLMAGGSLKISFGNGFKQKKRYVKLKDSLGRTHYINLMKEWPFMTSPMQNLLKIATLKAFDKDVKVYPTEISDAQFIIENAERTIEMAQSNEINHSI